MLRSMMKNQTSQTPDSLRAEEQMSDWSALSQRIQQLAHRRSETLLADHDDDAFDRGARALRTLMSAAEVAHRMKREEAKERDTDDRRASGQGFTEADIEAAYRRVSETVDRLEREDAGSGGGDAAHEDGSLEASGEGTGGDALGAERA